ncbi:MAG: hypothetical protein IPM89_12750 [Candidatus Competibacteraceae bacterium]|nr:MAG: hypothetical protein IPM89_12750 [Candidatus Competibacteraceae bacterium]
MSNAKQVAFSLRTEDHDRLKRLSAALNLSYSATVAKALRRMEESDQSGASEATSRPLVVYARLPETDRAAWKTRIRELRQRGGSFAGIGKRLFQEDGLAGGDGLPLSAGTIRSVCAL